MTENESLKSGTHLYDVEFRDYYLERPGFRVAELHLSPSQSVPWHFHTNIADTFYVLSGKMRLFVRDPKETIHLTAGESYCVDAGRPHLVTNNGDETLAFVILQGMGEYDYVPLVD